MNKNTVSFYTEISFNNLTLSEISKKVNELIVTHGENARYEEDLGIDKVSPTLVTNIVVQRPESYEEYNNRVSKIISTELEMDNKEYERLKVKLNKGE